MLLTAGPAAAHPLGNFTINHLTKIEARPQRIDLRYVLDMAEIPSFQVLRSISPDARVSQPRLTAWGWGQARAILPELHVAADGKPLALTLDGARARSRPGAGGLQTVYLSVDAHAAVSPRVRSIVYHDDSFAGRIGWRDVVVAPALEPTNELTRYPSAQLASPPDTSAAQLQRSAAGAFVARTLPSPPDGAEAAAPAGAARSNALSDMLARGTRDPGLIIITLLAAVALGALHALEPGHGKALMAATLVGARATAGQAAVLAAALTFAHTAAVLALGIAINAFKGAIVPEAIYPWITLLSGVAIAVIGARAIARHLRHNAIFPHVHDHGHVHAHDGVPPHSHAHAHLSDGEHARAHAIPGSAPMRFGPAVWAAMSGGIAPCPAALVVLLAAISLNQVVYGVVVIVAFSFGLAATLTAIGIAVVRTAAAVGKHPAFDRFAKYGPIASATVMAGIGCVLLGQGFRERGFDISPILVALLAALAIAGYALTQAFGHRRAEAA